MKSLRKFFTYVLHYLSFLLPRSKNIWVFIGWHRGANGEVFADNAKYLFLHVSNNKPDIQAVWLAKDPELAALLRSRGYVAYYEHSVLGIWYALRAGTTIIDAYLQPENFRWTGNTRLVQLLHGKGMKKEGYAQMPLHEQEYIFSTSSFVSEMLPPVFTQQSTIVVAGYPRADIFFKDIPGSDIGVHGPTRTLLINERFKKRFLYAPTFRRGAKTLELSSFIDLPHLSKWLSSRDYLLVMSLHPKYRDQARDISHPNIHFIEDSDVYPLLSRFDVLINDYSSIFTDFLLLDKPIVFYPYDLEIYKEKEGLTYNYDDYTPGPKAYTYPELIRVLEKTLSSDTYGAERARVRDLYHTYKDGNSSERIMTTLTA